MSVYVDRNYRGHGIGAALSIIDGTGPLSGDGTWGDHMAFKTVRKFS